MTILEFNEGTINPSVAINDLVYYVSNVSYQWQNQNYLMSQGELDSGVSTHIFIGNVSAIIPDEPIGGFKIVVEEPSSTTITPPMENDYIFFVKSNKSELSTLKGYYSEVTMKNNSPEKAELYAVSVDTAESSK